MGMDWTLKRDDENERQYIWRICRAKDTGLIDCSWEETALIINRGLGKDEDSYLCESAYRKAYQMARDYYDDVFSKQNDDQRLQAQKKEMTMLATQLQDQRREYNKILTGEARAQHLRNVIREAAKDLPALGIVPKGLLEHNVSDCEAVLFLSDWHYGMKTKNVWNVYNTEIAMNRMLELACKVREALLRHQVSKLHVVILGDMVAGAIHTGTRVAAEELVCEQLMHVSELLAEVINDISQCVPEVQIYTTYGNHSRTIQNLKDSVHADNMERIIPWWLEERFSESDTVNVVSDSECSYDELLLIPVCGWNIAATHGDLDSPKKAGATFGAVFSRKFGKQIDYVVLGHWHHSESVDTLGVDTVVVPSLCGVDSYAHTKRLYSEPGQSLMMFSSQHGRECIYTIRFTETSYSEPTDI